MIKLNEVSILDILPYTFKTEDKKALAAAIKAMTDMLYKAFENAAYRSSLQSADSFVLDALAAELDSPFYSRSMSDDQKKSIIAAAGKYNGRVGTVGAVKQLIGAAFGTGEVEEWFGYGGEPYHFRLAVLSSPKSAISPTGYKLLESRLDKIKPKRAKLDGITFKRMMQNNIYVGIGVIKSYKKSVIPAGNLPVSSFAVAKPAL